MTEKLTDDEFNAAVDRVVAADEAYPRFSLGNIARKMEAQHTALLEKHGKNYDVPVLSFTLNLAENAVINEWVQSLRPEILAIQGKHELSTDGEPYYGATGGHLSYSFTPTSLGTILVVKEAITGKELNVTDALGWFFYG